MVHLGVRDTVVVKDGAYRSCDLYSSHYLGWVDNGRGNLDADSVENAAGVAAADGRRELIFLRGGVRPVAQQRADELGVALLNYRERDSSLDGRSQLGREFVALTVYSPLWV